MSVKQQLAYWKHQARRHEARVKDMGDYEQLKTQSEQYQALVTASQTDHERAVAEARRQGHAEAMAAAGGQLVDQWMRAAAVNRLSEDGVNSLLDGLDRSKFLNAQGGVDTDKVFAYVGNIAPAAVTAAPAGDGPTPPPGPPAPPAVAPPRGADFGQGQPGSSRPNGLAAGREEARRRFGIAPPPS